MNKPTFMVGEIILSDKKMGKIVSAYLWTREKKSFWVYGLEVSAAAEHPEDVSEYSILAVWRDNRWATK